MKLYLNPEEQSAMNIPDRADGTDLVTDGELGWWVACRSHNEYYEIRMGQAYNAITERKAWPLSEASIRILKRFYPELYL